MIDLKNKKNIIGVIHLAPTIGYDKFIDHETLLNNSLHDLKSLDEGGVDAIMIENNYDFPHKIVVSPETVAFMGYIIQKIKENTKLPIGICVLWNDYRASLTLAKIYGCDFIRVPVFVDEVKTDFGGITGNPKDVIEFRRKISGENITLLTDIQVKHAELVNKRPIEESAIEAINKGSNGLIITGKWTADAPTIEDLKKVKKITGEIPVVIGSGANKDNIKSLFEFADAVIISTSLKEGEVKSPQEERNIKSYEARIDINKVKEFIDVVKSV